MNQVQNNERYLHTNNINNIDNNRRNEQIGIHRLDDNHYIEDNNIKKLSRSRMSANLNRIEDNHNIIPRPHSHNILHSNNRPISNNHNM